MDKTYASIMAGAVRSGDDTGLAARAGNPPADTPGGQCLHLLYRRIPALAGINLLWLFASTWLAWNQIAHQLLLPWLVFMGLNCVLLQGLFEAHQRRTAGPVPWQGMLRFLCTCIALGWGVAGLMLLQVEDTSQLAYIGMMALLLLASVPLLGIDRAGQMLFSATILTSSLLWPPATIGLQPGHGILLALAVFALLQLLLYGYYNSTRESLAYAGQQARMCHAINQAYQQSRQELQRHRHQQRARNSEHNIQEDAYTRLQSALGCLDAGVAFTDRNGALEFMNTCAERLTGWPLSAAQGRSVNDVFQLLDDESEKPLSNGFEECRQRRQPVRGTDSSLLQRRDGLRYAVESTLTPMLDGHSTFSGAVISFRDVTDQRNHNRRISWEASHDPLTKLINRREFSTRLEKLLLSSRTEGRGHALCYLDLDQFKRVNDSCGHAAGDQLLLRLAASLQNRVRETDTLARLGGDEFGLLLYRCELEKAQLLAEGISELLTTVRFDWQENSYRIGASIGLVMIDDSWDNAADLLKAAAQCCYQAKHKGGNRIQVYDRQHPETGAHSREQSLQDIMRLLERDDFDISLLGIRPLSTAPAGQWAREYCEVKVHMHDLHGETIPADRLLATAERYRILPKIDRWVTKATIDAIRLNNPAVADKDTIAIRISAQSLLDEGFLDYLAMQLDSEPVDPSRLCFIIKGNSLPGIQRQIQHFIAAVKGLGCRVALEDFDAGLESLCQLKSMRVDYIKIGGEILADLQRHPQDHTLIEAINRLGHTLGARTIAGQVNDQAQLAALRAAGVDYIEELDPSAQPLALGQQQA